MLVRLVRVLSRATVSLCVCVCVANAANTLPWQERPASAKSASAAHVRTFDLDTVSFASLAQKRSGAVTVSLPLADGGYSEFTVRDSGTMPPELAERFPEIRSLTGEDAKGRRVRLDISPAGVEAMIFADGGVQVIRPKTKFGRIHESFSRADFTGPNDDFTCGADNEPSLLDEALQKTSAAPAPAMSNVTTGDARRKYRLALAATGEYTTRVCSPNPAAVGCGLAAMVTTMNRVNEIYERDLAVTLQLVPNEDALIYLDGATDPYTNTSGSTMLGENQTNITSVIGTPNFDIGHVFSTGGGGTATVGVTCSASSKARGVTGRANPVGDPFDIDYVAHEIGHQFHATHTFNGNLGSCSGNNRVAASAFEPGSGSTIMGYAGICGAQNLQAHSDAYFHARSLEEMQHEIAADLCDIETPANNAAPTIAPIEKVTIPARTPFALRANAQDADGDIVTYAWEQVDLGAVQTDTHVSATQADGPIIRSFEPTPDPERVVPRLTTLLGGAPAEGEVLPAVSRTLHFRVSARDNRAAVSTADATVEVIDTGAAFAITAPNTPNDTWTCGNDVDVTWNVAGTAAAPISCPTVDLALSQDGGVSFDRILANNVPNTGSAVVRVPFATSATARIQARCSNNIFLDINDADFAVVDAGAPVPAADALAASYEDEKRTVAIAELTANDALAGGADLASVSNPVGGMVAVKNGQIEFQPTPDFAGNAGFDYSIKDRCDRSSATTASGHVSFPLTGVNDAPTLRALDDATVVAQADIASTLAQFAGVASFGGADEASQSVLGYTVEIAQDVAHVLTAASIDADGTLHYTLTGATGSATLSVRVRDSGGSAHGGFDTSAVRTVTFTTVPGADVRVALDDGVDAVAPGQPINYTVMLENDGGSNADQLRLRTMLAAGSTLSWTCTAVGTSCPAASGTGNVDTILSLPIGASVRIAFATTAVSQSATGTLVSSAKAEVHNPNVDGGEQVIAATHVTQLLTPHLFSDGME